MAGLLIVSLFGIGAQPASAGGGFHARVSRLSPHLKRHMRGISWHRGCPVPLRRLRLIKTVFHGFDGDRHRGRLVVNKLAVGAIAHAFRAMWRSGFKIRRLKLVDHYGGSDRRSMRADNTSAFNCRTVAGTSSWSQHAYGRAIDINPVENPYVASDGSVHPRKGRPYVDRSQHVKGMIRRRSRVVRAFRREGWGWGGNWTYSKDYQHFSSTGG